MMIVHSTADEEEFSPLAAAAAAPPVPGIPPPARVVAMNSLMSSQLVAMKTRTKMAALAREHIRTATCSPPRVIPKSATAENAHADPISTDDESWWTEELVGPGGSCEIVSCHMVPTSTWVHNDMLASVSPEMMTRHANLHIDLVSSFRWFPLVPAESS